jgi:hypothetical protein
MIEKLATPAGRAAYAERKWLPEAPNGWSPAGELQFQGVWK